MPQSQRNDDARSVALDALRDRFRATRAASGPALEEVVRSVPAELHPEALRQLLPIELEYHASARHPLTPAEAVARFRPLGPWAEGIVLELFGTTESWGGARVPVAEPVPRESVYVGSYELLARLGSGAFGAVFKARHEALNRLVALKVLLPHRALAPGAVERFFREMQALGQLTHPHIVPATDAGEAEGYHFLAMELVEGIDLGSVLRRVGRVPVPEACELARQAALALAFLADRRAVHRDVKPSNLLLGRDGVLRVLDLGLAHLGDVPPWEQLTETGAVMGTPEYMSPEQTRESRDVTGRSDVYSLGCTLFALLTGGPPFPRSGSSYDLFRAHNETPPPRLRDVRPGAPEGLEQLLLWVLEKVPANRPTAHETASALVAYCGGADLKRLGADCGPRVELPVELPPSRSPLAFSSAASGLAAATATFAGTAPADGTRRPAFAGVALAAVLALGAWALWPRTAAPSSPLAVPPEQAAVGADEQPRVFKPGEWTELLDRPPVKRIWPTNDPRAVANFDAQNRHLHIDCPDLAALELCDLGATAFDVEAVVFQNAWTSGRIGLFFDARVPPAPSPFVWHAETLYLRTLAPLPNAAAVLARGEIRVLAGGGKALGDRWLYDIPRPVSGDCTLAFTVGPAGTTDVKWCDAVAATRRPVPVPGAPSSGGGFGVFVQDSSAQFRSVRVRPHPLPGVRP